MQKCEGESECKEERERERNRGRWGGGREREKERGNTVIESSMKTSHLTLVHSHSCGRSSAQWRCYFSLATQSSCCIVWTIYMERIVIRKLNCIIIMTQLSLPDAD